MRHALPTGASTPSGLDISSPLPIIGMRRVCDARWGLRRVPCARADRAPGQGLLTISLRAHGQLGVRRKPIYMGCTAMSADAGACIAATSSTETEAASKVWDTGANTCVGSGSVGDVGAGSGQLVSSLQGMRWARGAASEYATEWEGLRSLEKAERGPRPSVVWRRGGVYQAGNRFVHENDIGLRARVTIQKLSCHPHPFETTQDR